MDEMLKEGPLADSEFNRIKRDPKTGVPVVETVTGEAFGKGPVN